MTPSVFFQEVLLLEWFTAVLTFVSQHVPVISAPGSDADPAEVFLRHAAAEKFSDLRSESVKFSLDF